ncbi:pyruvate dehydrogenase (acetyl-transferring) E1 component subunit alpha [Pontibacillus litoralis]|uniref:Pyruvate dehydrogenase E1 component subunit alpha n=1 Tax=Pontibacillus litoralis JSM 072002 TaxID=1385512 RepID=A0A0A5G6Z5_9BACI|nr:pyruvate dehydrogenase (acetyl-transferring) E1 component subunit alpha [Pontibacillus litoralis]KGX86875.1 pyruvate dehydrogenase E1 subunit alpha [Pontibacillus litoralis JSM 072002]
MEQQFPIKQLLNEKGEVTEVLQNELLNDAFIRLLYYHLIRSRTFDRKCVSLQRQGRIGTYAPFEGQEAAQVGSAMALEQNDWLFPTYRDHAATMTFGHDLTTILLYWNGRNESCIPPEGKRIIPPAVPIATQLPHATGTAIAEQKKGTNHAVIAYFGDGATSEGDFHEGLNIASVFQAPVVFFNQNNQYAISVPIEKQMKSKTIAQKAMAYDMPSVRIDGNDVFSVYRETKKALDRARNGEGPTLIEAVTWRYGAHTTADDPTKYRNQEDSENRRKAYDPILRLEKYMLANAICQQEEMEQMKQEVIIEVEQAVEQMEQVPPVSVDDIFDYVFAESIWPIEEQKRVYYASVGKGEKA